MSIDESAYKEEQKKSDKVEVYKTKPRWREKVAGFADRAKANIKAKIQEKQEFSRELKAEENKAFRKERFNLARKAGKAKARGAGGLFSGSRLVNSRAQPERIDREYYLGEGSRPEYNEFGGGLRDSLLGTNSRRKNNNRGWF